MVTLSMLSRKTVTWRHSSLSYRLGKIVVKDKLRNEGMRKYFEKPKKDQKAVTTQEATHTVLDKGVGQITEGASGLSITETTSSLHHQKRKKAVIPQYVSEEQQARRSPRIAKRARSLVDEVSHTQTHTHAY